MKKILIRNLENLLENNRDAEVAGLMKELHPADVAEIIEPLDADLKVRVFGLLESEQASEVLMELTEYSREHIITPMPVERLTEVVAELDSDDAADIVADLTDEEAAFVLDGIEPEDSAEVRRLLLYDEESAGGIMQVELVSARADDTVADAIEAIREMEEDVEDISYVFVVDDMNVLRGWVGLRDLLLASKEQPLREIMEPSELVIKVDEDQEKVAKKFMKYDINSAPVVDEHGKLLGRITIDDVFDVYSEEVDEDFYRMAGTSEEEVYSDEVLKISRLRLPWLLVNLSGGLVTGYLMWLFKVALQDVLALVTFIPAIMALGGSVGIQSSTIVVRGMAIGRVGPTQVGSEIFKEFRVAMVMGLVCGTGGGLVAQLWHGGPVIGVIVGLAMFSAITLSSVLGALTPAAFRRFNIDPALASGPFVTMCNDILGIAIYMGIATFFLKLFK